MQNDRIDQRTAWHASQARFPTTLSHRATVNPLERTHRSGLRGSVAIRSLAIPESFPKSPIIKPVIPLLRWSATVQHTIVTMFKSKSYSSSGFVQRKLSTVRKPEENEQS